jgi:mannosylglycerate hydrolase
MNTYHIVSHSHWDREWYKTFEQFRSMLVNMVDDLITLLERDPAYRCFTLDGQTVILDDYLAVRPEREATLRALVQQGRLITGPWYILPDEFLVSAESTVRNLLHGTATARRFGGTMDVGYIPDSFGHIAMMPAILSGFGIPSALVYRGFGGEPDQQSSEYWWHSPDGTRCLMVHLYRDGYSGGYFYQESDGQILSRFAGLKKEMDARATTSHRLIMNGGDHHWPDPRLPRTLDLLRARTGEEFVHSSVPAYVQAVRREIKDLPDVYGELRFGYRYAFAVMGGVYSSRMYVKQANWHAQQLLQRYAEPLNALGVLAGMKTQLPLLKHAWRTLLQNHPHDSICGCSIDPVHREMMTRFSAVEDIGNSIVETGLRHVIPYDDLAAGDDRTLFLFNPSPIPRTEMAAAEVRFYLQDIVVGLNPDVHVAAKLPPVKGFGLFDENGKEVPIQILDRVEGYDITYSNYNYPRQTYAERFSILVDAHDVPPMGWKGYTVRKSRRFRKFPTALKSGSRYIENAFLRADVRANGEIVLTDKTTGRVVPGLHLFEDTGDVGDEYNYSYPKHDVRVTTARSRARVERIERGPLRVALSVRLTMSVPESAAPGRRSRSTKRVPLAIRSTISLTPSSRSLWIETEAVNSARDHRFRVLFPSGFDTDSVLVDSQFAVLERTQKRYPVKEFTIEHPATVAPMQRFVGVRDQMNGLVILADGLPEYELLLDRKGTIALTLLRCVGLLAGEDLITRPGGKSGWHNETPDAQCPGTHRFRYAVLPVLAEEMTTGVLINKEAERFHAPLLPVRRKNAGSLPMTQSFCTCESGRLTFSAFKEAEDGTAMILRLYNASSEPCEETISFAGRVASAERARLDETPCGALTVEQGSSIRITAGPAELVTLRILMDTQPVL